MCGRYSLTSPGGLLAEIFELGEVPVLEPRYNVAPTQAAPVVRAGEAPARRELALLRWGLIPASAEDARIGAPLINARVETAASRPAFQRSFRRRRCLVPADGFYEWRRAGRRSQPFHVRRASGEPFAFAGLWDRSRASDGAEVESFAILTMAAGPAVAPIHDRMPVIVARADHDLWLDPAEHRPAALAALLRRAPGTELTVTALGPWVNDARHDDPRCLEPA
jgi:putative SOS response-associated peptidase YedK